MLDELFQAREIFLESEHYRLAGHVIGVRFACLVLVLPERCARLEKPIANEELGRLQNVRFVTLVALGRANSRKTKSPTIDGGRLSADIPRCTAEALPEFVRNRTCNATTMHAGYPHTESSSGNVRATGRDELAQLTQRINVGHVIEAGPHANHKHKTGWRTWTTSCGFLCSETCRLSLRRLPAHEHWCIIAPGSAPRSNKRRAL